MSDVDHISHPADPSAFEVVSSQDKGLDNRKCVKTLRRTSSEKKAGAIVRPASPRRHPEPRSGATHLPVRSYPPLWKGFVDTYGGSAP